MESCIYTGIVRHRRLQPRAHHFSYRVFMMYLDLDEVTEVFRGRWLWSARWPAPAWFRRSDFLGPADISLKQAVYHRVAEETGTVPDGPVRVLTNLRYFGYQINPITCYYVFSRAGELQHIVAEVTNTPWRERTSYVIPCQPDGSACTIFGKQMHVSPFMPMDMNYHWRSDTPGERLNINLQNWQQGKQAFNASVSLQRRPATAVNLARTLAFHPLMTVKVAAGIYWQALRLFIKRIPFVAHPDSRRPAQKST